MESPERWHQLIVQSRSFTHNKSCILKYYKSQAPAEISLIRVWFTLFFVNEHLLKFFTLVRRFFNREIFNDTIDRWDTLWLLSFFDHVWENWTVTREKIKVRLIQFVMTLTSYCSLLKIKVIFFLYLHQFLKLSFLETWSYCGESSVLTDNTF